ncbi:MAG: cyanophycin synthetase [Patescibacteria group bacterium]|nr:cyanophycin synthetase [Patescibacteria group bacterium]
MKPSSIGSILRRLAKERGVKFYLEPRYGYVGYLELPDGQRRFFRGSAFDLNTSGATELAKDKDYTSRFLKRFGYPAPDGQAFFTDWWCQRIGSERDWRKALTYAQSLGWPLIVKPNSQKQGIGVAKVHDEEEFKQAVEALQDRERVFIVQKVLRGRDYRLTVLDGEVVAAYERRPLSLIGDGRSTLGELWQRRQTELVAAERELAIESDDFRLDNQLKQLELSWQSKPVQGEQVKLLPNANLSTGGEAKDLTRELYPAWRELAAKIARDINLRFVGIDIISPGGLDGAPGDYSILELNASPGLANYASLGPEQGERVEEIYRSILEKMLG